MKRQAKKNRPPQQSQDGRQEEAAGLGVLVAVVRPGLRTVILLLLVVPLVLGIADGIAAHGTQSPADRGTFKATAALVTDDTTHCSTAETTKDGTGLSVGARGTGDAGKRHSKNSKFSGYGFHKFGFWEWTGLDCVLTKDSAALFRNFPENAGRPALYTLQDGTDDRPDKGKS